MGYLKTFSRDATSSKILPLRDSLPVTPVVERQLTQPTLRALTGIRIVAASWVVVEHFRQPLFALVPWTRHLQDGLLSGYLGVEVFFILSGFIISYNYADRLAEFSPGGYRRFLQLRFARLYPVHLVTLLAVALLFLGARLAHAHLNFEGNYTPVSFGMNLTMMQALPPAVAWNGPAWSISAEAAAYVTFPLIAFVVVRLKGRIWPLILVLLTLSLEIYAMQVLGPGSHRSVTSYTIIWVRIAGEFTIGCLLWAFWQRTGIFGKSWDLVALAAVAGSVVVLHQTPGIGPKDFYVLPFFTLFIFASASAAGPIARFLSSSIMEYGGRISYSLYMVHFIVLMVGGKLLNWNGFINSSLAVRVAVLSAYFAAAFLGALITYHWVEEPGRRWIRSWRSMSKVER